MKNPGTSRFILTVALALAASALTSAAAGTDLPSRTPVLDSQGRFWVYHNGSNQPPMPLTTYGWMSDTTNLAQLIHVDVDCPDHPNPSWSSNSSGATPGASSEKERCIRVKLTWGDALWANIAFISGTDKPPWWGDTKAGRHYNLSSLPKKKLVFFARGERGGEIVKAQIGALGDRPFGDSLPKPVVTDDLKLTKDWVRYEVDLKDVPSSQLTRICNGFGLVAERLSQPETATETQFYIDDVYYE